jgi:hypothetical protein
MDPLAPDALESFALDALSMGRDVAPSTESHAADALNAAYDSDFFSSSSVNQLLSTSSFSSEPTTVVPLIAQRVSLPDNLCPVPLARVLPPAVAAAYTPEASATLLRPRSLVAAMDLLDPPPPPRIAGARREYVELVH